MVLFCRRTPVQSVRTVCTDPRAKTQHEWFHNARSLTAQRLGVLMRAERRSPSRIALSEGDSSWLPFLAPCTICPDWKDLLLEPQGIYTILQPQGRAQHTIGQAQPDTCSQAAACRSLQL